VSADQGVLRDVAVAGGPFTDYCAVPLDGTVRWNAWLTVPLVKVVGSGPLRVWGVIEFVGPSR
jgi:hypothetical protein